jgi:colanic acid/amylovoran biosynthesis glycosyltransferase
MTLRRVAYVVNVFPKFSETFVANELAELGRRGVEMRILSLRQPAEDEPRHDVVTRAGLLERAVYEPRKFARVLRTFRPDLIHGYFATEPTAIARELAAELGVPFTFGAHAYDIYRRPPEDFAARAAAARAVVTVSAANARYIARAFGVPPTRMHVIPCGIDTERFRPGGEKAWPPTIVCVARLVPVKNHALLLEVCADLRARGPEFRCVLVGDGRSRGQVEATRARLGLEDVVELVGVAEQAEVLAWWQRATVAVLTSHSEGMPVALMEASACGVPAVATAVAGVPELIEDGVSGLLAPPGDRAALGAALERLLRDPVLSARMGAAGRRRAEARFSLRLQVDRLLALWSTVTKEESAA